MTMLATIFKPDSETKFEPVETDIVRGRKTVVFDFATKPKLADQRLTCKVLTERSTLTGIKGNMDRHQTGRVLKVESEATDIPSDFPCPTAKRNIDYDWVNISDQKYLLPLLSDVRLTVGRSWKDIRNTQRDQVQKTIRNMELTLSFVTTIRRRKLKNQTNNFVLF